MQQIFTVPGTVLGGTRISPVNKNIYDTKTT